MRIYMAGSWKNEGKIKEVAQLLREAGHQVDCFCDPDHPAVAGWDRFVFRREDLKGWDDKSDQFWFQEQRLVKEAHDEDVSWIDWAEAVVLVLPSGRSAHLEAGYAVGAQKVLFILGDFPGGEVDVMYLWAKSIHRTTGELILALAEHSIMAEQLIG